MLRVSSSQLGAINNNQLKAAAEYVATMALAEATEVVTMDLRLVAVMMTAVTTGAESIILLANTESIILSAPPAERMILSAPPADATHKHTGTACQ
jgi:hypothetical protein